MTTNFNDAPVDDTAFDRLVDGELSEAERRKLLSGLDDAPNGWRRCALAFLEAQCWKQTFGPMVEKATILAAPASSVRPAEGRRHGRLTTLLAMAACFLVAFWIGSLFQQIGPNRMTTRSGGEIARTPAVPQTPIKDAPSQTERAEPKPWQVVAVAPPSGSESGRSPVQWPAVERDRIDPQWLSSVPQAMPENVRQAFQRAGHQVEQHRDLVPVPLKDGRQMVVPVDQVDVHYVNHKY